MDYATIRVKINQAFREDFGISIENMPDSHDLKNLQGFEDLDDIDRIEIAMSLEDHFSAELDDDAAMNMQTISDLIKLVQRAYSLAA